MNHISLFQLQDAIRLKWASKKKGRNANTPIECPKQYPAPSKLMTKMFIQSWHIKWRMQIETRKVVNMQSAGDYHEQQHFYSESIYYDSMAGGFLA